VWREKVGGLKRGWVMKVRRRMEEEGEEGIRNPPPSSHH
jgi:hypothetical protein